MSWISSRRVPLTVLALALVITLAALWGFYTSDGAAKARERDARLAAARESGGVPTSGTSGLPASLEVETVVASATSSSEIVELAGALEPVRSTWVAAEIAGRIVEVPVEEHASVAQGDVLVRLDAALPRAELIRAEANHALARAEFERQQRLGQRSVASEAELDRARAEERRSYAALLEARTRLGHTRITSPFDGLVNALDLDPGAYVQPGVPIAEILDLSAIEVTVLVGDRQVGVLEVEAPVRVRVDALGSERFEGRIARVARAPRDESGRYPVVVRVDGSAGRLLPGMLAHVEFELGDSPSIRLPSRAVLREFELDYVFVLDDEDRARRVRVSTRPVPFRPDRVEIRHGVEVGERVIVSAVEQLRDGLPVLVR